MIPLTSREPGPVSAQVAQSLAGLLDRGAFLPGEALPRPEELAWQMALNPRAVRRAYEALADQGRLTREGESYIVAERRSARDPR